MADYSTVGSLIDVGTRRNESTKVSWLTSGRVDRLDTLFTEDVFHSVLMLERRRAERSRRPFVLMLISSEGRRDSALDVLEQAFPVLASTTRESDLIGWYKDSATIGVIFTELGEDHKATVAENLLQKVTAAFQEYLGERKASRITISAHAFPEHWERERPGWVSDSKLYPELRPYTARKCLQLAVKRGLDILGSSALLLLLSPALALIALIIKLTSKGPVLFRQTRLGQAGAQFKCLKFRTMYTNCDARIHREFVQQFIAGSAKSSEGGNTQKALYKITDDPRVTPFGRFLRKTSLDEFPQFWNVLRGEMSLVGPRPPVPYEFEVYDVWHRRRVFELKPGVTGLWQVSGRSRTQFDEMVRLDLRYSQQWSLWLDLKILLATPWAVFKGDCA
jgi:lipopolysaccharide/colanic/teichoic acid biosynthesis glycosyltransferase